jgi:hypothetical protein
MRAALANNNGAPFIVAFLRAGGHCVCSGIDPQVGKIVRRLVRATGFEAVVAEGTAAAARACFRSRWAIAGPPVELAARRRPPLPCGWRASGPATTPRSSPPRSNLARGPPAASP